MRILPIVVLLLSACALAGCGESKSQVLGKCRLDAAKATLKIDDPGINESKTADLTMFCMQAAGYEPEWTTTGCNSPTPTSWALGKEECYVRKWF